MQGKLRSAHAHHRLGSMEHPLKTLRFENLFSSDKMIGSGKNFIAGDILPFNLNSGLTGERQDLPKPACKDTLWLLMKPHSGMNL